MVYLLRTTSAILLVLLASAVTAQNNPELVGMVKDPCPPPVVMAVATRILLTELFMKPHTLQQQDTSRLMSNAEFVEYNNALRRQSSRDWPQLCRFHAANSALIASGKHPHTVFIGDSITENWLLGDPELFSDGNLNRGIGAQTTPQMLLRFRADVVALKPDRVHILAGTNDVAGNTGPNSPQNFKNNLMSMVDLARANGIGVMLGSIPPAATFSWQPALDPVPQIRELNAWIKTYAEEKGLTYIDYYSALTDAEGGLRSELGNDGVHPNFAGYAIMRRVLESQ